MHKKEDGRTDGQTGLKIIYIEDFLNIKSKISKIFSVWVHLIYRLYSVLNY
jgi:hypothetical protein